MSSPSLGRPYSVVLRVFITVVEDSNSSSFGHKWKVNQIEVEAKPNCWLQEKQHWKGK